MSKDAYRNELLERIGAVFTHSDKSFDAACAQLARVKAELAAMTMERDAARASLKGALDQWSVDDAKLQAENVNLRRTITKLEGLAKVRNQSALDEIVAQIFGHCSCARCAAKRSAEADKS